MSTLKTRLEPINPSGALSSLRLLKKFGQRSDLVASNDLVDARNAYFLRGKHLDAILHQQRL